MGSLFSKASEKQKEQTEQKSEVAEQSSPKPQQTVDVPQGDSKGQQDECLCKEEDTSKQELSAPSDTVAAGQSVVASQPPAEPQPQPDEKKPEVSETPAVQEQQPLEQQQAEPVQVGESTSEAVEKASSEPASTTAVCGDEIVEPEKEQAGNEVTSPAPEVHHPDVDKLADDVTQLKIVPDEAPAETSNEHEATSSVTTEIRLETDSEPQPTVNDDHFVEQDNVVPVDSALEQRLIENEAA